MALARATVAWSSPPSPSSTSTDGGGGGAAFTVKCPPTTDDKVFLSISPPRPLPPVGRRPALSACFTALTLSLAGAGFSRAAILEADDDEELLERVKQDRKKRIQRQDFITSSDKETGYIQELVYKLSKVGQAIEDNDLSAASSVLGPSTDTDWAKNVKTAFTKLSSSTEEKIEVDNFNSSLASLFTSGAASLFVYRIKALLG